MAGELLVGYDGTPGAKAAAAEALQEALALAEQAGVPARGELVEGRPSSGLVDLADETDAQMIVVGSYGEPPLKGALIGSTAHKLLHLSERPVLVVRAAA